MVQLLILFLLFDSQLTPTHQPSVKPTKMPSRKPTLLPTNKSTLNVSIIISCLWWSYPFNSSNWRNCFFYLKPTLKPTSKVRYPDDEIVYSWWFGATNSLLQYFYSPQKFQPDGPQRIQLVKWVSSVCWIVLPFDNSIINFLNPSLNSLPYSQPASPQRSLLVNQQLQ